VRGFCEKEDAGGGRYAAGPDRSRAAPRTESLLARCTDGEFLDRPAIQNVPELPGDATITTLDSGGFLGPYRIESKLGEGGMGEICRAIDMRLGRAVAIQTTHERFSARLEREALAISSLNHPDICTICGHR
jgi:serine/threonine protein kinase